MFGARPVSYTHLDVYKRQVRSSGLAVPDLRIAIQTEQRGTADAVRSALPVLPELTTTGGKVLILYGDTPLLTVERLRELLEKTTGKLGMLATTLADPHGYGRLIRQDGRAQRIVCLLYTSRCV